MTIRFLRPLVALAWCGVCCVVCGQSPFDQSEWTGDVVRLEPDARRDRAPVVTALAIHPDGQRVALGGDDHSVRIWDLRLRKQIAKFDGHSDWVRTVSFSPQGDLLVTSGNDRRVVVWNTDTGEKRREYSQLAHVVTRVIFSHDGKTVAVVGFGDKLRIIDGTTGDLVRELDCPCSDMRTVSFSPDDRFIVGGGRNGRIRLWESKQGGMIGEFVVHSQRIRDLAFSPDGKHLATCGEDRKVVISRSNGEQSFELPRHGAKVMSLVFCGADQLATAGSDNIIHVWDLNTRKEVAELTGHTGTIAGLAYHEGFLVSTGFDTTVRTWTRQNELKIDKPVMPNRVGSVRLQLDAK